MAVWLPRGETLGAVLLAAGALVRLVAAVLLVALVVFTVAIRINLLRGRSMSCGCFGSAAGRSITWFSVVRNAMLGAAAALLAAWWWSDEASSPFGDVMAIAMAGVYL